MKKILILAIALICVLSTSLLSGDLLFAQTPQEDIQGGVDAAAGGADTTDPSATLTDTIESVTNILTIVVGVVAVLMIIVAGYKYITSGGDPGKASSAKTTLVYAIGGIAIAALAQLIVKFVLTEI